MAILSGAPGQIPGASLDVPPPLPDSTKRPAPPQSNLMTSGGLGELGGSPQAVLLGVAAKIEQDIKTLSALLPTANAASAEYLTTLREIVTRTVGDMTQGPQQQMAPQGPPQGTFQGSLPVGPPPNPSF